jgi:hypothetical protein
MLLLLVAGCKKFRQAIIPSGFSLDSPLAVSLVFF